MKRLRILAAGAFIVLALGLLTAAADAVRASPAASPSEPEGYRTDNYNVPVPLTLNGVRALTADGAKALQTQGAILIDVHPRAPRPANLPASTIWRDPPHRSAAGAFWLPNVGYGDLSDSMLRYFQTHLADFTAGDKSRSLVFFCLRDCWMSWNASKRAMELGYDHVYWFSEGSDAWEENGYPIAVISPAP